MRIVSWNANYNGRRYSFDAALEKLESPADLRAGARLTVLDSDEWWGRSDHSPIVVEV